MSIERIEELKELIAIVKQNLSQEQTTCDSLKIDLENFDKGDYVDPDGYDEMLDSDGDVSVCGMMFEPSRIIKELDPIAYDCGLSDYVDSVSDDDIPEYVELESQIEECEENIEEFESELEDLESELEELEEDVL